MNTAVAKFSGWMRKQNMLTVVFYLIVLLALAASIQHLLLEPKQIAGSEQKYTAYNNYIIFKNSFFHLLDHKDLYTLYLSEQWDLYKYSPAFAVFFGLFAYMPDAAGLICWNLLNALVFFFAIKALPAPDNKKKSLIILFCFIELLGSLQYSQSNALMAGLIIFAFVFAERSQLFLSVLFVMLSVFIKIYGVVGFAIYLFYPQKIKAALYAVFWLVLLAILPLAVAGFDNLLFQYKSWFAMMSEDHSASLGLSVTGIIQAWFNTNISKDIVAASGVLLFCLPLLRFGCYKSLTFRMLLLSSVPIWMVIFNHKAESPTFIIAVCGVALWYFAQPANKLNLALLLLCLLFTTFSVTDLFPPYVRENFVKPYLIKAVMPVIIWFKLLYDMLVYKTADSGNYALHKIN